MLILVALFHTVLPVLHELSVDAECTDCCNLFDETGEIVTVNHPAPTGEKHHHNHDTCPICRYYDSPASLFLVADSSIPATFEPIIEPQIIRDNFIYDNTDDVNFLSRAPPVC